MKITINENFCENFEKPPKLKRLVYQIKLKIAGLSWTKVLPLTIFW